jgi:hypothetical protein
MATPIKKPPVIANMNGGLNYNTATTAQKQGMQDNWTKLNTDSAHLGSEMARAQQVKTDLLKANPKANTADQDAYITKLSGISAGGAPQVGGGEAAPSKPTALDYTSALSQANQQLDPMYRQAVKRVQAQQYQNQLNGGELASARGGAHSGLAADLQNKVNIAAAGEISGLDAQRSSQAAQMAQALLERDQDVNFRNRQQDYTEKSGDAQFGLQREQFDYGKTRDGVADSQWNKSFDYNAGRDKVADGQWDKTFNRNVFTDDRNYNRGVFESDRGYNRDVFTDDRDYNRGVLESDRDYSLSKSKASSGGGGGSKSSTSGIADVNQPWTVSDMKSYINKNLPGSKTGPMGPPSPNQQATIENLILSNPNLSDKSVIQLYQYYGLKVPQ